MDYAEILKAESDGLKGVEKEDETWMALARMAGERHAQVVTAGQVTTEGLGATRIKQKHKARWRGSLAHIDLSISLNQTDEEKNEGVMRVGILAHRHKDFSENETCTILQLLKLGQVHLDSW